MYFVAIKLYLNKLLLSQTTVYNLDFIQGMKFEWSLSQNIKHHCFFLNVETIHCSRAKCKTLRHFLSSIYHVKLCLFRKCIAFWYKKVFNLQVWKGQGYRKWKHGQNDGFFVQFESPFLRHLWFIPCNNEKGKALCRWCFLTSFLVS